MTIDYDRMNRVWPVQKQALDAAVKLPASDLEEEAARLRAVEDVCLAAMTEWDEIGAWPDDWGVFERALTGVQHWRRQEGLAEMRTRRYREEREAAAAAAAEEQREARERWPEHHKITDLHGANDTVAEFLEWLSEQGYHIGEYGDPDSVGEARNPDRLYSLDRPIASWIAQYFGINPVALAAEKDDMLVYIREQNALREVREERATRNHLEDSHA